MVLCELIAKKQWRKITQERASESLASELSFLEGIELAEAIKGQDFFDYALRDYSLRLLEAIRSEHSDEWERSWRYDAFLGRAYYFPMDKK
jgi:hypothetical protein